MKAYHRKQLQNKKYTDIIFFSMLTINKLTIDNVEVFISNYIHNGSLKNVQSGSHGWKKVIKTGLLCKICKTKQHAVSI